MDASKHPRNTATRSTGRGGRLEPVDGDDANGRRKIVIKPIEDERSRSVTFSKRKQGLMKKAMELAILCDCEVSVLVFGHNGKLAEFSSSSQQSIFQRYASYSGPVEHREIGHFWDKAASKTHINIPKDHPHLSAAALAASRAAQQRQDSAETVAALSPTGSHTSIDPQESLEDDDVGTATMGFAKLEPSTVASGPRELQGATEHRRKRMRALRVEIPNRNEAGTPVVKRDSLASAQLRNMRMLDAVLASGGREKQDMRKTPANLVETAQLFSASHGEWPSRFFPLDSAVATSPARLGASFGLTPTADVGQTPWSLDARPPQTPFATKYPF